MTTLDHKDKREIGTLLDTKIYEKVEGKDLNDSNFIVIVYFLIGLFLFFISLIPYSTLSQYVDLKLQSNFIRTCFFGMIALSSYMFAEGFLKLLRLHILNVFFTEDFVSFVIRKRFFKIRMIFTIVFFTCIVYFTDTFLSVEQSDSHFKDIITNITIILSVSFVCFLVSETIVDYFDFLSFTLNYKERVKSSKKRLKMILKLNKILPQRISNLKIYAKKLFKKMIELASRKNFNMSELCHDSDENDANDFQNEQMEKKGIHKVIRRTHKDEKSTGNSSVNNSTNPQSVNEKFKLVVPKEADSLTPQDFQNIFNSIEMFKLFDFDKNGRVTKHEFVKRYIYLFEEREKLKRALQGNANNMFKIQILMTSLFIPFIIFILLAMSGQLTSITESFTIAGLVVFPFSFAFKSVIEELFESVIFVFFIKPFDVGDIFFTGFDADSERYEVISIGILYSDFFLDGRFITLKNTSFNQNRIFNIRKSEFITNIYKLEFKTDLFLDKEQELVEKLDDHFSDLPTSSYKLGNYTINRDSIKVVLETKRVIPYQEIDTIEERHDNFIIYLNELLEEIGIE